MDLRLHDDVQRTAFNTALDTVKLSGDTNILHAYDHCLNLAANSIRRFYLENSGNLNLMVHIYTDGGDTVSTKEDVERRKEVVKVLLKDNPGLSSKTFVFGTIYIYYGIRSEEYFGIFWVFVCSDE